MLFKFDTLHEVALPIYGMYMKHCSSVIYVDIALILGEVLQMKWNVVHAITALISLSAAWLYTPLSKNNLHIIFSNKNF